MPNKNNNYFWNCGKMKMQLHTLEIALKVLLPHMQTVNSEINMARKQKH